MLIRSEAPGDVGAVDAVTRAAFPTAVEADLLIALREDPGWIGALSLVAVEDGTVCGHVVCTRATVGATPAVGLGPISVAPARQRAGIGSALLHAVLGAAEALGDPVVVLLGDPGFYARFGFVGAVALGITPPEPGWAPYFLARPLADDVPRGAFRYARPFETL